MFFILKWIWRSVLVAIAAMLLSLPLKSCGVDHYYSDDVGDAPVRAPVTDPKEAP
ncbi:MAG: hypothetical protein IV094_26585 [Vitreoscilla sp.]|nr:hypothetical protein [Vitreoscilla sp.]